MCPSPSEKDLKSILSSNGFAASLSGLILSLTTLKTTCLNIHIIYLEERNTLN